MSAGSVNERFVLDTKALLAYLYREPEGIVVRDLLRRGVYREVQLYLSMISFGEAFYVTWKVKRDRSKAQGIVRNIQRLPITLVDATKTRVLQAAKIKAQHSVSYADAFAVALAEEFNCPVITDDPEFQTVENLVSVIQLSAR